MKPFLRRFLSYSVIIWICKW